MLSSVMIFWFIFAKTNLNVRMAQKTRIFGATGSLVVLLSGLFKVLVLEYEFEVLKDNPKTLNWIDLYAYYYVFTALWSFEDFRFTLFVKSPVFAYFQWRMEFFRQQIASNTVTD